MANGNRKRKCWGRSRAQSGRQELLDKVGHSPLVLYLGTYLATIMGSSNWRVNLAVSLLFTNAVSGRFRLSNPKPTRSNSRVLRWKRTRRKRRIFAWGASSGREVSMGAGDLGLFKSEPSAQLTINVKPSEESKSDTHFRGYLAGVLKLF